jgi:hypothetical protein
MLVNSPISVVLGKKQFVLRRFFAPKSAPLQGKPDIRRLKTYSAQSGYVYQYFYEGHREFRSAGASGVEYVFSLSADRKNWNPVSVLVADAAVVEWQQSHQRDLSATERYAIAKMSLFQACDERATPELLKQEIRVRAADVEAIVETLGL